MNNAVPGVAKGGFTLNDIQKILPIIRKNWWIVLILGGISLIIGNFYVYKLDKIYASSSSLLLKSNEDYNPGSIISDNGKYYGNTGKTFIDNSNEIRVLKSQDLIEKALLRLDFEVSYFLVGRVRTTEVYSGVPFSVKLYNLNNQLYEQKMKFHVLSKKQYEITYSIDDKELKVTGNFDEELENPHMHILVTAKKTAVVIINGHTSYRTAITPGGQANYLIQAHRMEDLTRTFLSNLTVENPDYTNVLKLTMRDVLPERSTKFLDTLAAVYIDNSLQSRLEVNKNTLFFIGRQMEEVSGILDNIEDTLQLYRETNSVIDLDRQSDQYFNKFSDYEGRKKTLELQLKSLDDLENYVITDKDPSFLPPSAYILENDQFQVSTLEDLYRQRQSLSNELLVGTEKNQVIRNLRNRIDSTKRDILIYIKNSRNAIHEKIEGVDTDIEYYNAQLQALPLKQRGLLNIMRRQKAFQDMYIFLLQRRANTIISRAGIIPETKIIERPRNIGAVSPDDKKILYTFLGVGLIIALLIIFVRVLFFQRIESYNELKNVTDLPIVGEIIRSSTINELKVVVEHDPKSPIAESFRTIRTNLQYMLADKTKGVIVVTSNNPGEGKTFTSINLAAIISKGGKKVVLMELDLHKPRIQKGLGMEAATGVSTYVIGKNSIPEIIIPTAYENLDVVLSGPIPPNPSEIIVSRKMEELINYCRENYDFVIIDTPPVGLITDALVLMKSADVTLFVMNTKVAYRHSLNNAHEIVNFNKLAHFGFILNGVKQKRSKYYYNRYAYGYAYGYGKGYGSGYGRGYGSGYGSYGNYNSSASGAKSKPGGGSKNKNNPPA